METLISNAVMLIFSIALISYVLGTFRYFSSDGYSVINAIAQSFLHLFFCGYTLYGCINLLLNTPRLEVYSLTAVGGLWLLSCRLLFTILDFLRHAIPRKNAEETIKP